LAPRGSILGSDIIDFPLCQKKYFTPSPQIDAIPNTATLTTSPKPVDHCVRMHLMRNVPAGHASRIAANFGRPSGTTSNESCAAETPYGTGELKSRRAATRCEPGAPTNVGADMKKTPFGQSIHAARL
jgi:hypothetical protein